MLIVVILAIYKQIYVFFSHVLARYDHAHMHPKHTGYTWINMWFVEQVRKTTHLHSVTRKKIHIIVRKRPVFDVEFFQ